MSGPWPGTLAIAPRPRGGDWLEDEMRGWRRSGVDTVLSLLTLDEQADLNLTTEAQEVKAQGMKFLSLPIPDRQAPDSTDDVAAVLETLESDLSAGKNVVIHCRQGIGRAGLIAACLLISKGATPGEATERLSTARRIPVPETEEQKRWIEGYAAAVAVKA